MLAFLFRKKKAQIYKVDKSQLPDEWQFDEKTGLPFGWIVEGTGSIQCLCPYCDYGKGYNAPFIAASPVQAIRECETCKRSFLALVC